MPFSVHIRGTKKSVCLTTGDANFDDLVIMIAAKSLLFPL